MSRTVRRWRRSTSAVSARRSVSPTSPTCRSTSTSSCTSASRSSGSTSSRRRRRWPASTSSASSTRSSATALARAGPSRQEQTTMKYLDEFSDPDLARKLLDQIHAVTTQPWAMMEVCGGQTHSIIRHGIDQLLPEGVEMIHGPGCPVCVTPLEIIDKALAIAEQPGVIFCSFGDMLRVPGLRQGPLLDQERRGRRTRRVLPARRAQAGAGEPRPAGGVLRDRLRDHRAGQRDDGLPGQAARASRTSRCSSRTSWSRRRSRRSWSRRPAASRPSWPRATCAA